jgi:hypothetical protein
MLSNAHHHSGFVAISDWTLNSAVIMTNFQYWKHFMKYTTTDIHHDAAYYFDPPTVCVKKLAPDDPGSHIFVKMVVCDYEPKNVTDVQAHDPVDSNLVTRLYSSCITSGLQPGQTKVCLGPH